MSVHEQRDKFVVDRRDAYGKRVRLTYETRAVAEAVEQRMQEEARAARTTLRTFQAAQHINIGEAINEYLRWRIVSPRTRQSEIHRFQALARYTGTKLLSDVSPGLLRDYIEHRRNQVAPGTLYRESKILHKMFQWFSEQELIPVNPARAIEAPPLACPQSHPFSAFVPPTFRWAYPQ